VNNFLLHIFKKPQGAVVGVLFVLYVLVAVVSFLYLPDSLTLYPSFAVALGILYFGGLRLWPAVAVLSFGTTLLMLGPVPHVWVIALGTVLQSVMGAYFLHATRIDPLFRRYRDMFYLILTVVVISFISPTLFAFMSALQHTAFTSENWGHAYVASLFCFLVGAPLILRWCTKPRFRRDGWGIIEAVVALTFLTSIEYAYFVLGLQRLFGVPLFYLLLIPLFYISLRLRPRFVTLTFFITAVLAITGTLVETPSALVVGQVFNMELFLIVLTTSFYIVVSLEEDRRVNMNLMHTQLETLENAFARISSESTAKNDFIAILGHELRNPLAPVVSGIDLLRLKVSPESEEGILLAVMEDRISTVRRLLEDLLDISRISEGKVILKKETVDLVVVLKNAILSSGHHRNELHQSLVFKVPKQPIYVVGDQVRLEQIFSNLLTNASKYSRSGSTIALEVKTDPDVVTVDVIDEGVGIDPSSLESIFMPFHQIEQGERSRKGLGIGLALVHSFVEMHGGEVRASSPGKGLGSCFTVELPLAEGTLPTHPEKSEKQSVGPLDRTRQKQHVLIVDDNDAAAASLGRLLELQGCVVDYAYDGRQAIEKALSLVPDVVLLDIGLPDQDGYTVAAKIRSRGFLGRMIGLSGFSGEEVRRRAKDAGFDDFVVKPAGLAELKRVLPEI
jgi:signal transduction histidine kinase